MTETEKFLRDYVDKAVSKCPPIPDFIRLGMNTIAGEVPYNLKLAITLSETATFATHLRKNILLYDGTTVPCNSIIFAMSGSGTSKDKSLSAVRKCLGAGYKQIDESRVAHAQKMAERKAVLDGKTKNDWGEYYFAPKALLAGLGTVEGLSSHFATLAEGPYGGGYISSSEIGTELQMNGSMVDIIKVISTAYDIGNLPPKIIKSNENQTAGISGFPVSALFFGSHEAILFDNTIRAKFNLVFGTQLARRSIFAFTPEEPKRLKILSVEDLYEQREKERTRVVEASGALYDRVCDLVENTNHEPLTVSAQANKLFDVYLELNSITSESMTNKYPLSKLSRRHKQWLALKLAGTYAIWDSKTEIDVEAYAGAIATVELLSKDLAKFEKELVKEPYEQLADSCRASAQDGEFTISLHDLRKTAYVTGNASVARLQEICLLANSYDPEGMFTADLNGIHYREIIKTDIVGVSYKMFDTALEDEELKNYMSTNCESGYTFFETDFKDLSGLLTENAAYTPYQFAGGRRSKENLVGDAKFVVLDIDKTFITDAEAHVMLEEFNHYVVRTSDKNNEFKFRVLLELDAPVSLEPENWKGFIAAVAERLGLDVDLLPQSQIYLSYADRVVMKQLDGEPLPTKVLLNAAVKADVDKTPAKTKTTTAKKQELSSKRNTFSYAFDAETGERSVLLYRALAHAVDLGGDAQFVTDLATEINNYWAVPIDLDRLERTLVTPALRRI
jgi:hypothetical protein